MLSTDRTILEDGTSAQSRMRSYGTMCESLFVVVAGVGKERRVQLSESVTVIFPGGGSKAINFFRMLYLSRAMGADVISAQDPLWTGLIAVLSGKKAVQIQVHTDTWGWLEAVIAPYVLRRATGVRVVSARIKEKVVRHTKTPIAVLPIFIDADKYVTELLCPPEYGAHQRLLVVSRLAPEKRIHLVIDALAEVRDAHLYIVGDGPLRPELEARTARLKLSERVHFLGWKNDVVAYYQHADCFVQASAFEGYGMTLIEAALAGCPIVSTDVGIACELPRESVTIVEPEKYVLARAITISVREEVKYKAQVSRETLAQSMPTFSQYLDSYKSALSACTHT